MKRYKIVFLDAKTLGHTNNYAQLSTLGELISYDVTSAEQTITHINKADIVITNKVIIDRKVIDSCPSLKLICIAATGMNNVDLAYANEKGIKVRNVAGYSTESVVQVTFALLLYLLNKMRYYDDYTKSGDYARNDIFTHFGHPFYELAGKQYGIIGLGTIGKRVAQVAIAFGAKVAYYSTTGKNFGNPYPHLELNELLSASDVVSIHCPLTPATKNLIGYDQMKMMKPSSFLINVSRGGVIVESDLAKAIDEGLIAGAALDVLENEPPLATNSLFNLTHPERLVITPHLAWASIESRERLMEGIIKNISEFISEGNC
jgi:glycerate dehydrogenase